MSITVHGTAAAREKVVRRLRDTMRTIEDEAAANDGIYPQGKLTQVQLCQRAGISPATLQKATHKSSTLVEVKAWLQRMGSGRQRKSRKRDLRRLLRFVRN
jgi:hypothetical protein